jgi:hypothetical protein
MVETDRWSPFFSQFTATMNEETVTLMIKKEQNVYFPLE